MATLSFKFAPLADEVAYDQRLIYRDMVIHSYCIKRLQIENWRISKKDIAERFGCSVSTITRALQKLSAFGYATYDQIKGWLVFPTPQNIEPNTPETEVAYPKMSTPEPSSLPKNEYHIEKESFKEKETTTPEPIKPPDPVAPVVVFSEEEKLNFPTDFTKDQKEDAKHALKKVNNPALRQDVLAVLAHYMINSHIKSIPAYLNDLINRANNGKLGQIPTTENTKIVNKGIKETEEYLKNWRGINDSGQAVKKNNIMAIKKKLGTLRA